MDSFTFSFDKTQQQVIKQVTTKNISSPPLLIRCQQARPASEASITGMLYFSHMLNYACSGPVMKAGKHIALLADRLNALSSIASDSAAIDFFSSIFCIGDSSRLTTATRLAQQMSSYQSISMKFRCDNTTLVTEDLSASLRHLWAK